MKKVVLWEELLANPSFIQWNNTSEKLSINQAVIYPTVLQLHVLLILVSHLTCYCILCAQSVDRSSPGSGQWSASQLPHAWRCSAGLPVSGSQSQHCPGSREGRRSHSMNWRSHPNGVSISVSYEKRERELDEKILFIEDSSHSASIMKCSVLYWEDGRF